MIFKVPDDFKGSFVLGSLQKAMWAKMQISITGNDLYSPDVKAAVKRGILVPFIEGEYDEIEEIPNEVIIVNNTDRSLVLDDIVIKPGKSAIVSRDKAESGIIQGAESDGLISIITESAILGNKPEKKKKSKKTKKTESKKKETVEYVEPIEDHVEEQKTVAKIWDFQKGESEDAVLVNKVSDIVEVDTEEVEDVDMVDDKKKAIKKKVIKKKAKKKSVKKNASAKKLAKKKGKSSKSKKVKEIKPVGEVRELPDVAMPLDSRGNPLGEKPSDVMKSLIDEHTPDDISFADEEQKKERKQKRELSEDWDWEDL